MEYCDLHNHSNCSDGSLTPGELAKYAKEKGLCAIALTDHNTVEGFFEFSRAAQEQNIEYAFGTELTTDYNGKEIHLIAMFIDEKNADVIGEFTAEQLERKKESNIDLEANLIKNGYNISLEELHEKYGKNINRAHFARMLVDKGYYETTDEAFATVLKSGNGFYHPPKRLDFFDGIELTKKWGCVSIMAHPLLSVTKEELEVMLPIAKEKGLVAMEVYYPKFSQEEQNYLHTLAQKYGLLLSGGSDYHGNMKSSGDLGEADVPYSCYKELKKFHLNIDI